jgi:hypothetical protein
MSFTLAAGGASLDQHDGSRHDHATGSRHGLLAYRLATRITAPRPVARSCKAPFPIARKPLQGRTPTAHHSEEGNVPFGTI